MSRFWKYLFFAVSVLIICNVRAQSAGEVTFDSYSSEIYSYRKGLSQNTVQCIMQDSRGFVWIGTWDGLNRFDGYKFQIFRPDYTNPRGKLSCESINALAEDENGNLWIGTDKGLNLYRYKADTFQTFYYSFYNSNSPSSDSITSLVIDKSGMLWIGGNKGLCSYDIDNKKFTRYYYNSRKDASIPSDLIYALHVDDENRLWIGTNKGMALMDIRSKKIFRLDQLTCKNGQKPLVTSFAEAGNVIWVGTYCGVYVFDKRKLNEYPNNCFKDAGLSAELTSQPISRLLCDTRGRFWIATPDNGVYVYYPESCELKHIYSDFNSRYGLSNNSMLSLAVSQGGEVWIGTWHGLNMYSDYSYKLPHFRIIGSEFDYSNNLIWSFQQLQSGNLLIGTHGGLIEFDVATRNFSFFSEQEFGKIPVRALTILPDGNIWVGTYMNGLVLMNQQGHVLKRFSEDSPDKIAGNIIWEIVPDNKNNIWVAAYGGLTRINLSTFETRMWKYPGYESKGYISSSSVHHVMVDKSGIVWISTINGLNRLDPVKDKIYVFHHDQGNPVSISNDRILSTFEDSKGVMWVGTFGGGLCRYDRKLGVFRRFSRAEGFPDNVIYDIIEDRQGFLWLTSNVGVIRFNPRDFSNVKYDVNDGVQSHEFNLGASYISPEGMIAIGGMNGFNYFNTREIKVNRQIPKIVITEFNVFGKSYGSYIEDGDTIVLEPNNNFFSISFSALDYTNPSKNKYAYILKNYDKDWIQTDAVRRSAEYTDVKPGTYQFMVKGSNSDGIWNEQGLSFTVIVKPPFYKTWYFRFLLIALALFITWLFIRGRVRKVRQQNEVEVRMLKIEKEMFDLEQKALRLQMNPHFIFNSLNSIQSFIISNDSENAINYLAKFSQLMRLILTTSREAYIPLSQEISLLKHYLDLENMRFNNRFQYEIRVESGMDTEYMGIPPMIIQPYIENAIIHGFMNKKTGECRLLVQMWEEEDYILCVIEDNGIGREKAMEIKQKSGLIQKSQGIIITKERLDILNRQLKNKISVEITDLKDDAGNATGTRVRLVIPFIDL